MIEIKNVRTLTKTVLCAITITAPVDWKPLEVDWCHAYCPFGMLIPLNKECKAIETFERAEGKFDLCPFHNGRFQIKEIRECNIGE